MYGPNSRFITFQKIKKNLQKIVGLQSKFTFVMSFYHLAIDWYDLGCAVFNVDTEKLVRFKIGLINR